MEWFRKFTLRERLLLIFGHNMVVMIGVACQHSPGTFQPMIIGKCSKNQTPDQQMRENVDHLLVSKKPRLDLEE